MTKTLDRPTSRPRPPARRRRRRLLVAVAVTVLLLFAAAGAAVWWFFRGDAPAAVDLDTATASAEVDDSTAAAGGATENTVVVDAATTDTAADSATAAAAIAGTWTVDTTVGEFSYEDSTGTFVGFRIDEELAGLGSTTAVGRTPTVSGTVSIDATTVTAATIEADMTAVTTNDSRRDDRVQSALDTSAFPTATFVLTEPMALGDSAASGEAVRVEATGELTIHGVTRAVTIPLQAQLVDGTVVIVGSIDIALEDYGVSVPDAPIVLSAADTATLELQLFLQPS